jgi:hypothetical protein
MQMLGSRSHKSERSTTRHGHGHLNISRLAPPAMPAKILAFTLERDSFHNSFDPQLLHGEPFRAKDSSTRHDNAVTRSHLGETSEDAPSSVIHISISTTTYKGLLTPSTLHAQHWWFSGKIGRCHLEISSLRQFGQPRVRFPADAVNDSSDG